MTEYIVVFTAVTTSNDNFEETRQDLPAEAIFADDDDGAEKIARNRREAHDVIFNLMPTPGFRKNVAIKSIRNQENKRIIYWIGYSS